MTSHATTRPGLGVRIGTNLAGALLLIGGALLMATSGWPGLIKLAGFVGLALGFIASECWRHPERMSPGTPWVGFLAIPGAALVALLWPLALPGEQIATVAIVAGAAIAYCAATLLSRAHARRSAR